MTPLSPLPEPDWPATIDPAFQQRLLRPLTQPGVIRFDLAQQIWGRSQKLHDRLPLLQQLQRRQPPEKVTGGTVPIVHAEPGEMENHRGTEAQRRTETGGGGESTSPRSPTSPVIQAKFAPGAGPSAIAAAATALPLAGAQDSPIAPTPQADGAALVTPETVVHGPSTAAMSDRAASSPENRPLPLVASEPTTQAAIVPEMAPQRSRRVSPGESPLELSLPPMAQPIVPAASAVPDSSPDLPLVQVATAAIVTPESDPFKIQNSKFKMPDLPLVVPHAPTVGIAEGGFRESLSLPQSRLENPPLQSVLPRVQVDQGMRSPVAARSRSVSTGESFPAIPLRQSPSEEISGARSRNVSAGESHHPTVAPTPSPSSLLPNSPTFSERAASPPPPMPNLDTLTDQIERRLARRLAIARERRGG